jgi:endo-1,3-1,4-beta-glycanase ExoK
MTAVILLFLLLPSTGFSQVASDVDPSLGALPQDDLCLDDLRDCDLSLKQLRAQTMLSVDKTPNMINSSCKVLGCDTPTLTNQTCQCNSKCTSSGNCCPDYLEHCSKVSSTSHPASSNLPYGHSSKSKAYPSYPGFTLWLVEEFDQPIDLQSDPIWTWSDGGLKEGQVRFVKEQIKFEDGKLKIEVARNHGSQQPCSHAQSELVLPKPLVGGEIRTRYNMFRYGRYETRMKAPTVQPNNPQVDGNFVATMFVFRDASFKHWREIDLEVTGRGPGAISSNVISGEHASRWRADMEETDYPIDYNHMNVRSEFHDYAFEWLPGVVSWYVDGKKIREKHNDRLPVPSLSAKIMMNLWIYRPVQPFVPFGGKHLEADRFPMQSEYEWFRFYKWDGDKQYPPSDMSPKSISADDMYLTGNNPCDGIPQTGDVIKDGKILKACHATCGA